MCSDNYWHHAVKSRRQQLGDYLPLVKPPELTNSVIEDAEDKLIREGRNTGKGSPARAVIVSCIGILGKTGINRVPVAFNQQINAVIFPAEISPKYGFYYFQTSEAKDGCIVLHRPRRLPLYTNRSSKSFRFLSLLFLNNTASSPKSKSSSRGWMRAWPRSSGCRPTSNATRLPCSRPRAKGRLVPQDPNDEPASSCWRASWSSGVRAR